MIDNTQVTDQTGGAGLTMVFTSAAATVSNSVFANNLFGINTGNDDAGRPALRQHHHRQYRCRPADHVGPDHLHRQ